MTSTEMTGEPQVWFEELNLDSLEVHAQWQADRFDQRFANKLAATFKEPLVGVLSVAIDPTGRRQIWDGQHRLEALRKNGYTRWMCMITKADNRQQAELFVGQSLRRGLTWANRHAASVFVDPVARDIDGIVRNHGFVLTPGQDNSILAVSTMYKIYNRAGGAILDRTLNISKLAWPDVKAGRQDIVLDGIATFLQAFDDQTVDQNIIDILSQVGDSRGFVAAAQRVCPRIKDKGDYRPAKVFESFALYLAKEYGRLHKETKLHSKRIVEANRSQNVAKAAALVPSPVTHEEPVSV